jgi:3-isopropylmalate dehydrogenase
MLADHLGFAKEAQKIEQAVADDLTERQGVRTTVEIGEDIAERVSS